MLWASKKPGRWLPGISYAKATRLPWPSWQRKEIFNCNVYQLLNSKTFQIGVTKNEGKNPTTFKKNYVSIFHTQNNLHFRWSPNTFPMLSTQSCRAVGVTGTAGSPAASAMATRWAPFLKTANRHRSRRFWETRNHGILMVTSAKFRAYFKNDFDEWLLGTTQLPRRNPTKSIDDFACTHKQFKMF